MKKITVLSTKLGKYCDHLLQDLSERLMILMLLNSLLYSYHIQVSFMNDFNFLNSILIR